MMNKTIKTIGIIGIIGAVAAGSYLLGTSQAKTITKVRTVEKAVEVVPDGYMPLNKCIPLEDIACYYVNEDGYTFIGLKDVGNQLDDKDNASYTDVLSAIDDITDEYSSHMVDMDKVMYWEANDGLQLYYEDGSGYYWGGGGGGGGGILQKEGD